MNYSIIRYTIGAIIRIEGLFFLLPIICGLIYGEDQWLIYLYMAIGCILLGSILRFPKPKDKHFFTREGFLVTSLGWIVVSAIGALPFVLTGEIPSYLDALFETVSGFTTTGASILANPENVSNCSNIWRCFTHWIGGMGVLVFILAVIPMTGGSDINIMKAESPGPSVGKLTPQVKETTRILYILYGGISTVMFFCLVIAKMPIYDALCAVFGTAGTGGFGIKADSIGGYSVTIQWIITIFMLAFGVNFNFYYLIFFKKAKGLSAIEEVKAYFFIILLAIIFITINIFTQPGTDLSLSEAIRDSAFTVASIITTTGYSNCNFDLWPYFSKTLLLLLMFCGACAGSTGGGIKVSRFLILLKTLKKELGNILRPKEVKKLKLDGEIVDHEVLRGVNVFFATFMMVFAASVLVVSLDGQNFDTNISAVAACINNIGPGIAKVGPTQNYAFFSPISKIVLIIDMLIGRLELFPILILFHPSLWRGSLKKHK